MNKLKLRKHLNLLTNALITFTGMANPMTQMNSYYPGGAVAAYSSLSAASMAAAAAAAAAQQNAIAGLNPNSQQVGELIF